jgi:hypothetical protein
MTFKWCLKTVFSMRMVSPRSYSEFIPNAFQCHCVIIRLLINLCNPSILTLSYFKCLLNFLYIANTWRILTNKLTIADSHALVSRHGVRIDGLLVTLTTINYSQFTNSRALQFPMHTLSLLCRHCMLPSNGSHISVDSSASVFSGFGLTGSLLSDI